MTEAEAELTQWARPNTVYLERLKDQSSASEAAKDEDLLPLAAMVGGARIVAIGETFHHTREFALLRERLVRFLVKRLGFDTLVLEAVRPGRNEIDDYVRTGAGTPEGALIALGVRMWRNGETARFVQWLCDHNRRTAGRPVRVRGIDILAPGASMRAVLETLELSERARLLELSKRFDLDGRQDQIVYNSLSREERTLLRQGYVEALVALSLQEQSLRYKLGATAFDMLMEQTKVVLQALGTLETGTGGWGLSLAQRDEAMAENIGRLAEAQPDSRIVLLTHNMHAHRSANPTTLGTLLGERYGERYLAIGTLFGCAEFDPPIYGVSQAPGEDLDSIDQLLKSDRPFLLDLRPDGGDRPAYLAGGARMQATGTGSASHVHYAPIGECFDLLAFVPRLTNARQLIDCELSLDVAGIDASRT